MSSLKNTHRIFHQITRRCCSTQTVDRTDHTPRINVNKYDKVTMITIDNPSKKNALNTSLIDDLVKAVKEFENDENSMAGVICGDGGNFCVGADLDEIASGENIPSYTPFNNLIKNYIRKPLIAAITGYAVGLGFELALWCDLRIMDETAVLGDFGRRFGATMSETSINRLQAIVGFSRAMDIIMTVKRVKSEEAYNCGLANRVSHCGTSIGAALNTAGDLAKLPQSGLLTDRAILYKCSLTTIGFQNSDLIEEDCVRYKSQTLKDLKTGAQLFKGGAGKHGEFLSRYLWSKDAS